MAPLLLIEDRNRVLARLELLPGREFDPERVVRLLHDQLRPLGLNEIDLAVERVAHLAPDPVTGKIRRAVSRVGPPEDLRAAVTAEAVGAR